MPWPLAQISQRHPDNVTETRGRRLLHGGFSRERPTARLALLSRGHVFPQQFARLQLLAWRCCRSLNNLHETSANLLSLCWLPCLLRCLFAPLWDAIA